MDKNKTCRFISAMFQGLKHRNREARLQSKLNLNQVLTYITTAPVYQRRAISIKLQEGGAR
jgi:hypothetical protein